MMSSMINQIQKHLRLKLMPQLDIKPNLVLKCNRAPQTFHKITTENTPGPTNNTQNQMNKLTMQKQKHQQDIKQLLEQCKSIHQILLMIIIETMLGPMIKTLFQMNKNSLMKLPHQQATKKP